MTPLVQRLVAVVMLVGSTVAPALAQSDQADRVRAATTVLGEIMAAPDSAVPKSVLDKAEAIAVFPFTVKGAFIVGAQRGRGIISVRDRAKGTWSMPAFLTLTGGSFGFQIGGQAADIVLVVQDRRAREPAAQSVRDRRRGIGHGRTGGTRRERVH